jgi:hypothetical protein
VIATAILETGQDNVGRGRIEVMELPAPFFQVKKEFGIRAGGGNGGLIVGEVYGRPLRMGPMDVEVRAFATTDDANGSNLGLAVLGDYRF